MECFADVPPAGSAMESRQSAMSAARHGPLSVARTRPKAQANFQPVVVAGVVLAKRITHVASHGPAERHSADPKLKQGLHRRRSNRIVTSRHRRLPTTDWVAGAPTRDS